MGIFNTLMGKIFGEAILVAQPVTDSSTTTSLNQPQPPVKEVDVTAILDRLSQQSKEKLDWKSSIVDLMKLVGIDSSLAHRKELATELGCDAKFMQDSASLNIWLQKQVMKKLVENGGIVPKELL